MLPEQRLFNQEDRRINLRFMYLMEEMRREMFLMRLDDACEYMDVDRWAKMEELLDKYHIRPIVGIIPSCKDQQFLTSYSADPGFWEKAMTWQKKGWTIALHGYEHRYHNSSGGCNPYTKMSEFADLSYEDQAEKIRLGYQAMCMHGLIPTCFFAPSHTFDANTVQALMRETPIRVICDTIAGNCYKEGEMYYIPLVSSHARKLPLPFQMFCYHPNSMSDGAFLALDHFLSTNRARFTALSDMQLSSRKKNLLDKSLSKLYFLIRARRKIV